MWADLSCQTTQWHLPSSLWFHTCSGQTRFSLQLYNAWLTVSVATPDWMSKPIAWMSTVTAILLMDKTRQLSNVSTTSNVNTFRCWFLNSPLSLLIGRAECVLILAIFQIVLLHTTYECILQSGTVSIQRYLFICALFLDLTDGLHCWLHSLA